MKCELPENHGLMQQLPRLWHSDRDDVHPVLRPGSRFWQRRFRPAGRTGFGCYPNQEEAQAELNEASSVFGKCQTNELWKVARTIRP